MHVQRVYNSAKYFQLRDGTGSEPLTRDQGRRQGFRPGWAEFGANRRKNFSFAHPGFQFAHPAIRIGCPPYPPYRGGFKGKGLVGH